MEILRAFEIAKREWENIRISLEYCGDIGDFDSENPLNSSLSEVEGLQLTRNLIEMDNKLRKQWYFTLEAAYVFSTLAPIAGERLGLVGRLAEIFGRGYSWVRTGWFDSSYLENQHVIKQMIFVNLFLSSGPDLRWDFNSPESKTKLKIVFNKFVTWQDKPKSYLQDVRKYRNQLENFLGSACH